MVYYWTEEEKKMSPARRRVLPGKARKYISLFRIKPGDKVIIACRVSTGPQEDKMNLDDQERFLRRQVERSGGTVIGVVKRSISGVDPFWLGKAVALAKKTGTIILAESTDRFIRHPSYHSKNEPDWQARHIDLDRLRYVADGVELMTFLDPEATPGEVRSHQTRRGQQLKGRVGGRPKKQEAGYKKRRREELLPEVRELRKQGKSQRQISREINVAQSTIHGWLSKCC